MENKGRQHNKLKKMGLDISCIRHKEDDHTNRINEFADDISEIKEDIEVIKQTNSRQRQRGNVFFFPPN